MIKFNSFTGFLILCLISLNTGLGLSDVINLNVGVKNEKSQQTSFNVEFSDQVKKNKLKQLNTDKRLTATETSTNNQIINQENPIQVQTIQKKPVNFKLQEEQTNSSWYDIRWRYRKNITIFSAKVVEQLNNFPVLVDIFDEDLRSALNNGNDILFTDSNNNKLAHEIELFDKFYNSTHTHLVAWIKTNLSSTIDTTIIMYYGFPFAESQQNPSAVWSNGYEAVWHLNEKPSETIIDSAGSYNGTALGGMPDDALEDGFITKGLHFDGSDDRILTGNINSDEWSQLTLEAWISHDFTSDSGSIITKEDAGGGGYTWSLRIDQRKLQSRLETDGSGGNYFWVETGNILTSTNTWYHVAWTWDGFRKEYYIDGMYHGFYDTTGQSILDSIDDVSIGASAAGNAEEFNGLIDEVRVSSTARSEGWIVTQRVNQFSPNSFYSLSTVEKYDLEGNWPFESLYYRKNITVSPSLISQELENFPFLIDLTDSDLHDKAQVDGEDILFTDELGNRLEHEIEKYTYSYNSSHSRLIAWIKIPSLSNISTTTISIYYGNSSVIRHDTTNGVWSDYMGVWHLSETVVDESTSSKTHQDSTIKGNDGDQAGNDDTVGQISKAQYFDGIDDSINVVNPDNLDIYEAESYTISAWILRNNNDSLDDAIIAKRTSAGSGDPGYIAYIDTSSGKLDFSIASSDEKEAETYSNTDFNNLTGWHYINIQFALTDGAEWKIFIDGIDDNAEINQNGDPKDVTDNLNNENFAIGAESDGGRPFDGRIDEVRIAKRSFSASWIWTEYYNQLNPQTFYSIGSELIRDFDAPTIQDFGIEDQGKGQAKFWANITDNFIGVADAFIEINGTSYNLQFNGTFWIYQMSPEFNTLYNYRILNTTDYLGNNNTIPTIISNYTFNKDEILPEIINWQYFPLIGEFGTFKANVTDSWGKIDTVLLNFTGHDGYPILCTVCYSPSLATMRFTGGNEFINDSITLYRGTISYVIIVNDTSGNIQQTPVQQDIVLNRAPSVSNLTFTPSFLLSNSTNLTLSFIYIDPEGDEEEGTQIRWYKNSLLQTIYNDIKTIPSSALIRGDQWNVTVKPKDGTAFGLLVTSSTITVENSAPIAFNLMITPFNITTLDDLSANWDQFDEDGDNITLVSTHWYKNAVLQTNYNDSLSIPYSAISKGQQWYFTLILADSSENSTKYFSPSVTIINTVPVASGLTIAPSNPVHSDTLTANWFYSDADGDVEISPRIRWYKNGILQSSLNDSITVDWTLTTKGDTWSFTIQVNDGEDYSLVKNSPTELILNNAPEAVNLTITNSPITTDWLEANWTYIDGDNDPEDSSRIRWYRNGVVVSILNDLIFINPNNTNKGETWYYTLQVFDSFELSILYTSSNTTILNSAPRVSNAQILPGVPSSSNNLVANWDYVDDDSDVENVSDARIRWYLNGTLQIAYNNTKVLPFSVTTRGDQWYFTVQGYDGNNFSLLTSSVNVTIINSAPIISSQPTFNNTEVDDTDDFNIVVDFFDEDGDNNVSQVIYWYIKGIYNPLFDNQQLIYGENTTVGDFWWYIISVYDGFAWSVNYTSITIGIGAPSNFAPSASDLMITLNPNTSINIVATYNYTDPDGHPESGSKTRWYMDNGTGFSLQVQYNDSLEIPFSDTVKGQQWFFRITPFDVFGANGSMVNSSVTTVVNSIPTIEDGSLQLTTNPDNNTDLTIFYSTNDDDNDSLTVIIRWYKTDILQPGLNDSEIVSSNYTKKHDKWNYTIQLFDGTNYSFIYNSSITTILNTAPLISGPVTITPSSPDTQSNLGVLWNYFDIDGDFEGSPIIRWYKYGVLNTSLNDLTVIPASNIKKGEIWYFTVQVFDGDEYSDIYVSDPKEIVNTAPEAVNLTFTPSLPIKGNDLQVSYIWTDIDQDVNDFEIGTLIRWYRNDILVASLNDTKTVPGNLIIKGDVWNVTIVPSDGTDFGSMIFSAILIGNSAPQVNSVSISPSGLAKTLEDLSASYEYSDVDGDIIIGISIQWFNGSNVVPELNNQTVVPSNYTRKGQIWSYEVKIYDGTVWSDLSDRFAVLITILNSAPTVTNIILSGGQNTLDNITISYDYQDNDLDLECKEKVGSCLDKTKLTWKIIRGGSIFSFTNLGQTLSHNFFISGDFVFIEIQPFDGENFGQPITTASLENGYIIIDNSAPAIVDLPIIMTENKTNSFEVTTPLFVFYNSTDPDDLEGNFAYGLFEVDGRVFPSNYRWYRNGILIQELETYFVPIEYLFKGDIWNVSVRIPDRYGQFSNWVNSSVITIKNSEPSILSITWNKIYQTSSDEVQINYVYYDNDDDQEELPYIRWFVNGIEEYENENETSLSSTYFSKKDNIYVLIRPYDGELYGRTYNSSDFTIMLSIGNTLPVVTSISINYYQPTYTNDNLSINWDYFDFDGDNEVNTSIFVYWYKNGELVEEGANNTRIPSSLTTKNERWQVYIQVYDGENYSLSYSSNSLYIQNSIPILDLVRISSNESFIYANGSLTANYNPIDFDNDPIRSYNIYWYLNGQYQSNVSDQTLTIQSSYLHKGDSWYFVISVTDDDQNWSSNYTSQLIFVINSNPSVSKISFDFPIENLEPILTNRDFYLDDEEIQIDYIFNDIDNDNDQSMFLWYKNDQLQSEFINLTSINSELTTPGEIWYVIVIPYDGENTGIQVQSSEIIIEGIPEIHEIWTNTPESELFHSEGYYEIFIITNISNNNISNVVFNLDPDVQNDTEIKDLINKLSITTYSAKQNGSKDIWSYSSIDIIQTGDRADFSNYIGKNITIEIIVYYQLQKSSFNYTIARIAYLNFMIEDKTPPTVKRVNINFDNVDNPSQATFFVEIAEFGDGIQNATVYYFFQPVGADFNDTKYPNNFNRAKQAQTTLIPEGYNAIPLSYLNSTFYTATINFNINSSVLLLYIIQVSDKSGNFNMNAWPEGTDADQAIKLSLPNIGLAFEEVFVLILVILILASIFSYVVIKKYKTTEIVGFDIEEVMKEAEKITQEEIERNIDEHTLGIIISTFDQSHGPIPIFVHPDMLKDNIDKLIDLSDRSFSSTRFVENFEKEIQIMFAYVMTPMLEITSISYGYSLNRPDLRGGMENVTLNILMHKPFETIIAKVLQILNPLIHEIHVLMDQSPDEKNQIQEKIRLIRRKISSIILAHDKLYKDLPLEDNE